MAYIQSGDTADLLTVDPISKAARTSLYGSDGTVISKANIAARGANDQTIPISGANDDNYRTLRMDRMGNAGIASHNILFHEPFEGATVSTPVRLTTASTTFAPAQTAAGTYSFNPTASAANAAASLLNTNKRFGKLQRAPIQAKFRLRAGLVAGSVAEWGFGLPANQTSAPTVGAYFQITSAGILQGVLTFNSVDITTTAITMPGSWQNNFYTWDVILDDDEVMFMIQDTSTGLIVAERRIQLAVTQVRLWDSTRLPVYVRLHNIGNPASAPVLVVSSIDVLALDATLNRPYPLLAAVSGFGGEALPTTFAQSANYANSAAPSSATLSNTTPGYTTLGGQFQFAAVAGAETDYILFGFTSPAPYSFICTGVDIDTYNTGAAVATTATLLQWFISPDQTAASLATATNRRVTLGSQTFLVGAAVGAQADRAINRDFTSSPMVTHPGRVLGIGLKMPIGTATASQIIRGTVAIRGFFDPV